MSGEHTDLTGNAVTPKGSSPRERGALPVTHFVKNAQGIIPA